MLVEHSTSAFIGEISRRQAGDCHGALDKLLGRGGDAQLNALSLDFTIDGLFAAWGCHGPLLHGTYVR
jgi:hypothetical protein